MGDSVKITFCPALLILDDHKMKRREFSHIHQPLEPYRFAFYFRKGSDLSDLDSIGAGDGFGREYTTAELLVMFQLCRLLWLPVVQQNFVMFQLIHPHTSKLSNCSLLISV